MADSSFTPVCTTGRRDDRAIRVEIEVERNWSTRVLLGAAVPLICGPGPAEGHGGGFDLSMAVTSETAYDAWQAEFDRA